MEIGVGPAASLTLSKVPQSALSQFETEIAKLGLAGVKPGMELIRIGDRTDLRFPTQIDEALTASDGQPVELEFKDQVTGQIVTGKVQGRPRSEQALLRFREDRQLVFEHLLGLAPVMKVETPSEPAEKQGLRAGDIFARLGSLEFPSIAAGINEVRSNAGKTIDLTVLRRERLDGPITEVELKAKVSAEGTIGFNVGDSANEDTLLALAPGGTLASSMDAGPAATLSTPAQDLIQRAGTRILAINNTPVANFAELRTTLMHAIRPVLAAGGASIELTMRLAEPFGQAGVRERDATWRLDRDAMQRFSALGWTSRLDAGAFELKQTLLQASSPVESIGMGLSETRRVMVMTYLTFARLFEGTVKVEHLKGPVGIAHLGTRIAERGTIWLLFFLALVSVNLAVINFLPLPIVDGGQFIFLLIEQLRGKPVPIAIQNFATLAGLVLIIAVFGLVTFNDLVRLLG
jgi:regulator of sigma E protease